MGKLSKFYPHVYFNISFLLLLFRLRLNVHISPNIHLQTASYLDFSFFLHSSDL